MTDTPQVSPSRLHRLLDRVGPFPEDATPDDLELFDRLTRFGVEIWTLPNAVEQEVARQQWVRYLQESTLGIPEPWHLVRRAIEVGKAMGGGSEGLLRWYSPQELAALTPPAALVGDIIAEGSLVLMYGAYGVGKTFLAIDLGLCVAAAHPWHGVNVTQGPVAYILGEGRGGIAARVQAWHEAHGVADEVPFRILPQPIDFLQPARVTALLASMEPWDAHPKLLVVDTLYRCFGGSENDTGDMATFIHAIDRLRQATGAATLVLHHPGHDTTRGRGHSALPQAVDTIIRVAKLDGIITASCDKQRDGPPFQKRRFRLSPRGESMTVELATNARDDLSPANEAALAALHQINNGDGVSFTTWRAEAKAPNSTFALAVKTLCGGDWVKKARDRYFVTEQGKEALGSAS